jgi:hypothetical protein
MSRIPGRAWFPYCLPLCLPLLSIVISASGCGSDAPAPPNAGTSTAKSGTGLPEPVLKPDVPQTPDAAIKAMVDGLKASQPVVVWDMLPDQAQSSVNSSLGGAVAAIDAEVWDSTVANLKKLLTLLETKKQFILDSPMWKMGQLPKRDVVKAAYDPAVTLLKTIVDSELVDRQKMSHFDGHALLTGTGAKVMADLRALTKTFKPDPLAFFDTANVTVKKTGDRSAKVTVVGLLPNSKPIDFTIGIVDGRWGSAQLGLAANFGAGLVGAQCERFRPYQLVEWKGDYMKDMDRLGKFLDQLQAAKTSDDFQRTLFNEGLPLLAKESGRFRAKRPERTPIQNLSWDRKADTALVIVKGYHTFDEPTYHELTNNLRAIAPDTFRGPIELEGSTLFFVGPIDGAFDRVLKAAEGSKIAAKDKLRDTVTIELATSVKDESSTAEAGAKK